MKVQWVAREKAQWMAREKAQWMARETENILWLPPEYSPTCTTVHREVAALDTASGRVLSFEFSFNP